MTKKKDARRKVTAAQASRMAKMISKGKTLTSIAEKFGVTPYAVKYNTDSEFRASEIKRVSAY